MTAPSFTRKLRHGAEAAAFFLAMGCFRLMGLDAASAAGGFIGREIFARTRLTARARENLMAAFPEKSEDEIAAVIRAMWDNLGRTVAEYAHLDRFAITGPDARVAVAEKDIAAARLAQRAGALFVGGHFANWEVMGVAAARAGVEGAIVYRPPNNPYVARWIARARANGFAEQISKHHGTRRIFTLLRGGKSVLLLADQKTNEGIAVPFFGRDAMTTPAPAALALKLGAKIILASNRRLTGARFAVTLRPPLEFIPTGDFQADVRALTLAINAGLEAIVREDPSQWLWIHRRWPTAKDMAESKKT